MKTATLKKLIDRAGLLKAEVADRENELDEIKRRLIKKGISSAEGYMFRASVYETRRQLLDVDAVRRILSDSCIKANTIVSTSVVMKVSARNGEE